MDEVKLLPCAELIERLEARVKIETSCGNRTENPMNHVRLMDEAAAALRETARPTLVTDELVERDLASSLGGDDLVMRLMYELHAHVPEERRPLSMSDLSDEQAARARKAVHAVLVEWESARTALEASHHAELVEALNRLSAKSADYLALGGSPDPLRAALRDAEAVLAKIGAEQ